MKQLPLEKRGHRLDDFASQLNELQKNFSDLKASNAANFDRFRPLESELIGLMQAVHRESRREAEARTNQKRATSPSAAANELHEATPRPTSSDEATAVIDDSNQRRHSTASAARRAGEWREHAERELSAARASLGDIEALRELVALCQRYARAIEANAMPKKTKFYFSVLAEANEHLALLPDDDERAQLSQLCRLADSRRVAADEALRRTESVVHRAVRAEEIADALRRRLDHLKASGRLERAETQREISVSGR